MKIVLDGRKMTSKEEVHHYLAEALELPAYYGKNLDALHDCLTMMREETEILLTGKVEMMEALGKYGSSLLCVFEDAAKEIDNLVFSVEE